MKDDKKLSDSSFTYHYMSKWEHLHKPYDKHFSKQTDETTWIFRAQKRRKQEDPAGGSKSGSCPIEESSVFQTSLDEALERFKPPKSYSRRKLEIALIRKFQRKAHGHLTHLPDLKNTIEWLTLMQHYGAPTRLLDWTYSFFVALFFALTRLNCTKEYAEVWAINARWLVKRSESKIPVNRKLRRLSKLRKKDPINMDEYHDAILKYLFEKRKPVSLVLLLNSFRLNDRLIAQRGTFLVQGDIDEPFDYNLKQMDKKSELKKQLHRIVIEVDVRQRNKILKELNKMNINSATLFPSLQGFAESLASQLAEPEKLISKKLGILK